MQPSLIGILALSCVLTSAGYAQAPSSQSPPPATAPAGASGTPAAANPSAVAASQPVITLPGACDAKPGNPPPASGCVSTVTKEQFEKLVNALKPDLSTEERRNLAQNYGKMLIFADVARSLNMQDDPKVQQILTFYQNQILAQSVSQHYSQEYAHPSDQQIEDYYKQNSKKYTEATLQRVIIPVVQNPGDKAKPTDAQQKEYVDQVRAKWVAGGDPAKLQTEAMDRAGVKVPPPDVNVGAKRPGSLPVQQEAVFELKAGEVSQPFNDPSGSYIYKVVSVRQVPLSEVKTTIAQSLTQQQLKDKLESIANSANPVLNDTYFGPPAPPQSAGPAGMPGHSMPRGGSQQAPPSDQAPPK